MTVFCVETEASVLPRRFVTETNKRLQANTTATLMFKRDSFAYIIQEKERDLILVNIETPIFNLPKWFYYFIMKRGLRKYGYNGKIKRVNNNLILLKLARVFKDLPRRNTKLSK